VSYRIGDIVIITDNNLYYHGTYWTITFVTEKYVVLSNRRLMPYGTFVKATDLTKALL
jgi:hypothetical protein